VGILKPKYGNRSVATEKMRNIAQMVKCTLGTMEQRRGLTNVTEASTRGMKGITHSTKTSVEQACLVEAGHWFTQAHQTLCPQPPLFKGFGEIGVDQLAFN